MSEEQVTDPESEYTCPKCGKSAELIPGYDTLVSCKDCGETRIIMSFLSNGDIETVTADTNEYYELEPSVRKALKQLEGTKPEDGTSYIDAMSHLSDMYSETGREAKAESMCIDILGMVRNLADKGDASMRDRYFDQISVCAAYAIARGNLADATEIYAQGLDYVGDTRNMQVASLKVNYSFLCTMKKDFINAEKSLQESLAMIEGCFAVGDYGDDPYILATVYDSLRLISSKNNKKELAHTYLTKALVERRRLLKDAPVTSARLIELTDSMGFMAEEEAKKGNGKTADGLLDEAVEIAGRYDDCKDALANALMNRAKYRQAKSPAIPEGFMDDMNIVIPALEALQFKDKRTKENIAQAYMFRSMTRDPEDYDNLLLDLAGSYDTLKELAQEGDVNEMFFMSSAHSYLVLLNMKDHDKAQQVREELQEMGISQKDLDKATRGTIGNVSTKKTKVDLLTSQGSRPLKGRRLKKQIKHKSE